VAIETLFFCSALGKKIKNKTVLFSRQYNVIRKWGNFGNFLCFKNDAQNFSKEDYTQVSRKE
jgi:hypothetical protein